MKVITICHVQIYFAVHSCIKQSFHMTKLIYNYKAVSVYNTRSFCCVPVLSDVVFVFVKGCFVDVIKGHLNVTLLCGYVEN